jgi:hypothetical protein
MGSSKLIVDGHSKSIGIHLLEVHNPCQRRRRRVEYCNARSVIRALSRITGRLCI